MANITFTNPDAIIQHYRNLPNGIQQKIDQIEDKCYEKLTTHQIKNIVGNLMAKFHSGDYDEHDVHALHVFCEAYIKQRINPPVITEKQVDTPTCKKARLISIFQKHGYRGKGVGVDTEKMKSYLDTPHLYPDGSRASLTDEFGDIIYADDDMVVYQKGDKLTSTIRGSRTSPFDKNFLNDWEYNAKTIFSTQAQAKDLEKYKRQLETMKKIKEKYLETHTEEEWKQNAEILGYSQGGGNGMAIGEELECNTTTFNPHVNALHNLHDAKMEHTIHRTAEDPATLFLAFKRFNDNIKVKTHGSLKNYDNALDSHNLHNFTDWMSPKATYNKIHSSMNKVSTMGSLVRENKLAGLVATFKSSLTPDEYNKVVDHVSVEDLTGDKQALREKVQRIISPQSVETRIHDVGTSAPGNNMPAPIPTDAGNIGANMETVGGTRPAGTPTKPPPVPEIEPVA